MLDGFGAVSYRYSLSLGVRMKKMFLTNVLIAIFGISFPQAQPSRLDSVITKFQNDNRSFEEFVVLGKMMCYSKVANLPITVGGQTNLYFGVSSQLYNSLSPFARLLNEQSTIKSLEEYFLLNIKRFEKIGTEKNLPDKENLHYYEKIELCDSLYGKNENYKKYYLQFVSNKKNYLAPTSDMGSFYRKEIESYRTDYLENYFIRK